MDKIKSVWIVMSHDAVACCNEQERLHNNDTVMSLDLFARVIELCKKHSWNCTILCNKNGIQRDCLSICDNVKTRIILPAECKTNINHKNVTVVFESDQIDLPEQPASIPNAILRIKRSHLSELAKNTLAILENFTRVSFRHPQLLTYDDKDMIIYKNQLFEIGQWLLDMKSSWIDRHINCLTDSFLIDTSDECGAGIKSIAIGPNGELYLCPAAMYEGATAYGHILSGVDIPNRHLLNREYSAPCGKCDAMHCSRCIYLSKKSTFEYCVPSKNICKLAHFELEAQAWFANKAIEGGIWDQKFKYPKLPNICDPYELIRVEQSPPITDVWRRLVKFDMRPESLKSTMMLDIIHGLQGWYNALVSCSKAGSILSTNMIEDDLLASLRRHTIEQYRNVTFQEGCPTVHEIELLMCKMFLRNTDFS